MSGSSSEAYFIDGGTLRADTPSYVKRPADDELYDALMEREFCYILTPRQMGKSSLMIHTSQRLKAQNIKTAIVDIQGIGTDREKEWYASLLSQIRRGLKLNVDIDDWMIKKSNLGFGQLFMDFMQDVVLAEIPEQVVIFLDEVDWMIKIDFRDDFFASIRSIYNARAQYPEFNRVSFVLLGVASPADLISEPTRTPFNIGHAIPLQELSLEDATPLQEGLEQVCPNEGQRILDRIFYWTNGHPYLTQKLCKSIAEAGRPGWSDAEVDNLVNRLFLAEESRKEANLKFIQDRILSAEQKVDLLKFYKRARHSKVKENGQSVLQNQLMLSGLLTSRDGYLEIRNRIYRTVFNERWINQNMPRNWQRTAILFLGVIVTAFFVVLVNDLVVGTREQSFTVKFFSATSPAQRLSSLASIYRLNGILSNTDTELSASQLFYGLPAKDQQLAIFTDYAIAQDSELQNDLVTVVSHLYITVANVDPDNDNTELLQTMRDSLDKVQNSSESELLQEELANWFNGREQVRNGEYDLALESYSKAILLNPGNPGNPATLYERAKIYVALGEYANALNDLDDALAVAEQSAPNIPSTPMPTVSPPPASATANVVESPTREVGLTPLALTATVPSVISETPSGTMTPTLEPAQSPTPTPTPTALPSVERYESNFTTWIDILNAVQALIEDTPELQVAIQPNGDVTYANLDSVGLVRPYEAVFTATPQKTSIGESEGEVSIIAWAGYIERGGIDPAYDWVTQFEADTSCKVTVKTAATSDEMVALMNEGGFDLVTASGDASIRLIEAGLIQPINIGLIPSWTTIDERLQNSPWHTVNKIHYGVPFQWNPNVLMYNTDVFPASPNSWSVVFDEQVLSDEQSNKGRVQAYDGPIYIADAALYLMTTRPELGITDPYKLNRNQFDAAIELLRNQRVLINRYWHDAYVQMDDFKNEGVVVSGSWPFQVNVLQLEGVPIASTIPVEGATGIADTTMMYINAPHPNCAYLWLEHSLDAKVQGDVAAWFGSVPAVPAACTGNELLTDQGCVINGFDSFDKIYFWKTPLSSDQCGGESCVPYSEWVSAYQSIISGTGNAAATPEFFQYTVQEGDTWSSIAQKFNVDVPVLQNANQGVALATGLNLKIPVTSNTVTPTPSGPDFQLSFEKLHFCNGTMSTPWVAFKFTNIGNSTFTTGITKIVDVQTDEYLYGEGDGFKSPGFNPDANTCGVGEIPALPPGDVAYRSYALKALNPDHVALATIQLCSDSFSNCVERSVEFPLLVLYMTDFQFSPNELVVPAGQDITLTAINNGAVAHDFVIMNLGTTAGDSFDKEDESNIYFKFELQPGESTSITFTTPAETGEYQIVCSIPGHLASGMIAKLIVNPIK